MLRYKLKFLFQKVTEVSDQGKKKTAAFFQTKFISLQQLNNLAQSDFTFLYASINVKPFAQRNLALYISSFNFTVVICHCMQIIFFFYQNTQGAKNRPPALYNDGQVPCSYNFLGIISLGKTDMITS